MNDTRANIMVIDGADNCAYDVYSVSEDIFKILFPASGQNICFVEDVSDVEWGAIDKLGGIWGCPIRKSDVRGIDGIMFYELEYKKKYYPNLSDADLDLNGRAKPLYE